jgi:hypothetical protein
MSARIGCGGSGRNSTTPEFWRGAGAGSGLAGLGLAGLGLAGLGLAGLGLAGFVGGCGLGGRDSCEYLEATGVGLHPLTTLCPL